MIAGKKRGMSQYVAWILLVALAVVLGAIMFSWTRSYAQRQVDSLESRSDDVLCNSIGIGVDGLCQNSQTLNMNVSNTNNLRVDELEFLIIDLYGNSEKKRIDLKIATGETLRVSVLKQGTTASARITPIFRKNNAEIVCQTAGVTAEQIMQC
jgi:FlaG/FlaF family flagellin (archaellin)